MVKSKNKYISFLTIIVVVITTFLVSCKEEVKNTVDFAYDPEIVPMVNTDSVTMLISDSGMIRYKVITKTWEIFDKVKDPYWRFPDKCRLEQFDTTFNVVATVKADTVWYFTNRKLWQLKGHVFIHNKADETFSSEELFWDERQQKVYSNTLITIDRPGKALIYAKSFTSNQQMTSYTLNEVYNSKIVRIEEKENGDEKQQ